MAMLVPKGILRSKCSSTYSSPSGYLKETSLNSISPLISSQFSSFGLKESPYFSMTSGVSVTSDFVSRILLTLSMLTCVVTRSENASIIHLTGSIIP